MTYAPRLRTPHGEPTMLRKDGPSLPPGRPFTDDLQACDRRFGVAVEKPAPIPAVARQVPLRTPDPTLPLPRRSFVGWRVGYAAALPSLSFPIGLSGYAPPNPAIHAGPEEVLAAVEAAFRVGLRDLVSSRRDNSIARPRLAFYLLMTEFSGWSSTRIARAVNRHDHSTVLSGAQRARHLESRDREFGSRLRQARQIIEARHAPRGKGGAR